jgi:hypothetical protein
MSWLSRKRRRLSNRARRFGSTLKAILLSLFVM